MPVPRVFTLERNGLKVRELSTTFQGRAKTFRFPYTTDDPDEINYLLSRGAKAKLGSPPRPQSVRPPKPKPLKGGDEK